MVVAIETCALVSVHLLGGGRRFPQFWVVFLFVEQEVWTQAAHTTPPPNRERVHGLKSNALK